MGDNVPDWLGVAVNEEDDIFLAKLPYGKPPKVRREPTSK